MKGKGDNVGFTKGKKYEAYEQIGKKGSKNVTFNMELYKKDLCKFYAKNGDCPDGDWCKFAYGEHELRGGGKGKHVKPEKKGIDMMFLKTEP